MRNKNTGDISTSGALIGDQPRLVPYRGDRKNLSHRRGTSGTLRVIVARLLWLSWHTRALERGSYCDNDRHPRWFDAGLRHCVAPLEWQLSCNRRAAW